MRLASEQETADLVANAPTKAAEPSESATVAVRLKEVLTARLPGRC